jgi:hypothetical protein
MENNKTHDGQLSYYFSVLQENIFQTSKSIIFPMPLNLDDSLGVKTTHTGRDGSHPKECAVHSALFWKLKQYTFWLFITRTSIDPCLCLTIVITTFKSPSKMDN